MPLTDEQWDYLTKNSRVGDCATIGRFFYDRKDLDFLMDGGFPGVALTIDVPPPPHYVTPGLGGKVLVVERRTGHVPASFDSRVHPDAWASAKAEAARLDNREVER